METKKLKLNKLELVSFVTSIEKEQGKTLNGGVTTTTLLTAALARSVANEWCRRTGMTTGGTTVDLTESYVDTTSAYDPPDSNICYTHDPNFFDGGYPCA